MTVYRRNPLLMTVMGANPGPRTRKGAEKALDAAISGAWHRLMSGVQVPIMDIPRIFRDIKLEMAGGVPLEQAVTSVGTRYRVNRNPVRPRGYKPFSWDVLESIQTRELARHYITKFERETLLQLLQWNDRNASWWPDEASIREVGKPASWTDAVLGMLEVWEGMRPYKAPGTNSNPHRRRRVRRNPFGEAIVAGVAGAVMNNVLQSNPGPSFIVIDATSGLVVYTKRATGVGSEAIASCVAKAKFYARRTGRPHIVFLDVMGLKIGMKVNVGYVRAMGITEEIFPDGYRQGPRAQLNPAIEGEWNRLSTRSRLAVLEFAGIPEDQAIRLSHRPWGTLPPDIQDEVKKGWRDTARRTRDTGTRQRERETVRMNPGGLRPKSAKIYCVMCGEWLRSKGPYHAMKVGPQKGRTICDLCYRGIRSGRRSGESWARNPQPNPGSKRKMTMTVERFAAWVKAKKDPAMWRAFLAKFKGYEKWTHGAKARKVSVEWVETPGVSGLWITYDGGKQPESTYIMPKGSPRKGAWKHPWDTMPDIKHDPEAKIVITKLRGSSKITDFYHK